MCCILQILKLISLHSIILLNLILQAEIYLKVSAEFASSITTNTIKVHMSLPKYTTMYYYILLYKLIKDKNVYFTILIRNFDKIC
jgi:hypothetical protein